MNDYLNRQLIADRQTAMIAGARRRAQVREALAARRSQTEDRPRRRVRVLRFPVRRTASTTA
ncbi:MAG TPA: hypothetical protein VMA73_25540 [Streptosporangiaceae bacterium]|nr:hypothetical protein [Streptosporangiaceae bacterium]